MKLIDPALLGATLRDLLRADGARLTSEPAYLRARLSDRAPQAGREIALLVQAQSAGIPQALQANPPTASLRTSLISKLHDERGLSTEAADWAVDCWAAALGMTFTADLPKPIPVVPTQVLIPQTPPSGGTRGGPLPQRSTAEKGVLNKVFGVGGAIVGVAVGTYSGINLLLPLAAALLCGWLAYKWVKPEAKSMVPAFAVQAGHGLWMLLGVIVVGVFNPTLLDVVILAAGLTWLLARPGLGPVVLLGAYQCISFVINLQAFLAADVGSDIHRALLVHLIFRALGVALMVMGLQKLRGQSALPVGPPLAERGGNPGA